MRAGAVEKSPELVLNPSFGWNHRLNPPPTAQIIAVVSLTSLGTVPEFFAGTVPFEFVGTVPEFFAGTVPEFFIIAETRALNLQLACA